VGIEGLRPGRGASFSIPAVLSAANRDRHSETVFFAVDKSAAMSRFSFPAADASMILARNTSRAGVLRPRDQVSRTLRSSSVNSIAGARRIGFILLGKNETPATQLSCAI
jgi:hypothetical protein